jgi:hypothetical protein
VKPRKKEHADSEAESKFWIPVPVADFVPKTAVLPIFKWKIKA